MKDFQRIGRILGLIKRIWKKNPDLRLGQLIDNAIEGNIFYIED